MLKSERRSEKKKMMMAVWFAAMAVALDFDLVAHEQSL